MLAMLPGFLALRGQDQGERLIAALISDFLILRAVKRAMKRRER